MRNFDHYDYLHDRFDRLVSDTKFMFKNHSSCVFFTGFVILFAFMTKIPRPIKVAFHAYGVATAAIGVYIFLEVQKASLCQHTTTELYYLLRAFAVLALLGIGLQLVLVSCL
jgi:hypothetical protein